MPVEEPLLRDNERRQSFDREEPQRESRRTSPDVGALCIVFILVFVYLLFFIIFLLFGFHNHATIHKAT